MRVWDIVGCEWALSDAVGYVGGYVLVELGAV